MARLDVIPLTPFLYSDWLHFLWNCIFFLLYLRQFWRSNLLGYFPPKKFYVRCKQRNVQRFRVSYWKKLYRS